MRNAGPETESLTARLRAMMAADEEIALIVHDFGAAAAQSQALMGAGVLEAEIIRALARNDDRPGRSLAILAAGLLEHGIGRKDHRVYAAEVDRQRVAKALQFAGRCDSGQADARRIDQRIDAAKMFVAGGDDGAYLIEFRQVGGNELDVRALGFECGLDGGTARRVAAGDDEVLEDLRRRREAELSGRKAVRDAFRQIDHPVRAERGIRFAGLRVETVDEARVVGHHQETVVDGGGGDRAADLVVSCDKVPRQSCRCSPPLHTTIEI